MEPTASPLLEALVERQGNQSDRAFAARLRISHNQWTDTKRGKVPIGISVLDAAAFLWPELDPLICAYLRWRGSRLEAA